MERIRILADQGNYSFGSHVFERSRQRGIDITDVLDVLRVGEIDGPIAPGRNSGEWKCKVTATLEESNREIGVALVVIGDHEMFFITVEWEDEK